MLKEVSLKGSESLVDPQTENHSNNTCKDSILSPAMLLGVSLAHKLHNINLTNVHRVAKTEHEFVEGEPEEVIRRQ